MNKEIKILEFINEGIAIINDEICTLELDFYDKIKIIQTKKIFKEIENNIYIK
jgi:hypothetical protein